MSGQADLLQRLEAFANANNRSGYYQALADAGYDYGRLALGVVDNLTLNGRLANAFQYNKGQELNNPVNVTGELSEKIGLDLMWADLDARKAALNEKGGINLTVSDIRDYHIEIYEQNGLPPEAWTTYAPSVLIGEAGEKYENEDAWWSELLSTDDGFWPRLSEGVSTSDEVLRHTGDRLTFYISPTLFWHRYRERKIDGEITDEQGLAYDWIDNTTSSIVLSVVDTVAGTPMDWQNFWLDYGAGAVVGGTDNADTDLAGGDASDTIYAHGGKDNLKGWAGDDFLYGGKGDDVLIGGAGKDALIGGVRSDAAKAYHHEDGLDTADYSSALQGIIVNLQEKPDWFPNAEGWVEDDGDGSELTARGGPRYGNVELHRAAHACRQRGYSDPRSDCGAVPRRNPVSRLSCNCGLIKIETIPWRGMHSGRRRSLEPSA